MNEQEDKRTRRWKDGKKGKQTQQGDRRGGWRATRHRTTPHTHTPHTPTHDIPCLLVCRWCGYAVQKEKLVKKFQTVLKRSTAPPHRHAAHDGLWYHTHTTVPCALCRAACALHCAACGVLSAWRRAIAGRKAEESIGGKRDGG